jgi:hypothetical protein
MISSKPVSGQPVNSERLLDTRAFDLSRWRGGRYRVVVPALSPV